MELILRYPNSKHIPQVQTNINFLFKAMFSLQRKNAWKTSFSIKKQCLQYLGLTGKKSIMLSKILEKSWCFIFRSNNQRLYKETLVLKRKADHSTHHKLFFPPPSACQTTKMRHFFTYLRMFLVSVLTLQSLELFGWEEQRLVN